MIIINEDKTLGSKGFAHATFDTVKDALKVNLDANIMQEIENDITLFSELDLSELQAKEFNLALTFIEQSNHLNAYWQALLVKAMQADPRYQPLASA